ncbi:MAG: EscU/YscU/HrcU family type III secretion system export apparatus switch protein [Nitrospiraceae bacterium]|nr:MAG: EscU/YscU/HrcU family type III secretion system export apparatus switch protein [Nitrospiraceae bacterium]
MKEKSQKAAALKYRHGKDSAPKLVAKGRGEVAQKIIDIARENNIPLHEDKELVDFLSMLDLYEEIPPELYKAVAEILAFIYRMNKKVVLPK